MATAAGYSEEDLEVLEAEFTRLIERSITDVCVATAAQLRGPIIAAASSASLGPQDVAVVTQLWEEQVDGVLTPYVAEVYTGSAAQVAIGVADAFPSDVLPGVPLVPDQFALTYMKSVTGQFVGVGDELWEDIRNELLDGIQQGQSIPQIAARIQAVSNYTERHSTMVARTAVHTAAEAGNVAQVKLMGYEDDEVQKEWVATLGDGRTRPTHIAANGQSVSLNEKFTVGGWKLDHPGDILGPADEIINCRCTTVFNFDVAPKFRCDGVLTAATDDPSFCILPTAKPSIAHLLTPIAGKGAMSIAQLVFNSYMKHKITPAYGGAKIQKVLDATRAEMNVNYPGMLDGVSDQELLTAVDHYYVAKKDTFYDKWFAWTQTPAGKKVVGKVTPVQAVKTPAAVTPSVPPPPTPAAPSPPKLLGKPSSEKFTILDDPGKSGDGTAPMGQWGKYGASGVLVRAVDSQGVARFLLIQRGEKYIGSQKFKWQLPGGGMDSKEGPYEGAARELWEETAPPPGYVESMVPLGEMVYDGGGGWKYTTIAAHADSIFKPTVHGSTGDAKWFTLEELQQMVDEGKIVKELAPTLKQLAAETDELAGVKFVDAPKLPPVAPRPKPSDLTYTGKTLGSHGAQVWVDASGQRWLFKPQEKFLTDLDVATARIQSKAMQTRPGVYEITLGGKTGSIQFMFDSKPAFPGGSFDPLKLTATDLFVMQREQVLDWMLSNFDTHSGQWIRLADGTLFETDKGQSFKFFGSDKLSWDYVPVTPLGSDRLTYSALWKAFVQGKDVDLHDPTLGELGEFIDRLMAIPDAEYDALLKGYAIGRGFGGKKLEDFLTAAVKRKNSLKSDFAEFYAKAVAARAKALDAKTAVTPPVPLGTKISVADIGHQLDAFPNGKPIAIAFHDGKEWKLEKDSFGSVWLYSREPDGAWKSEGTINVGSVVTIRKYDAYGFKLVEVDAAPEPPPVTPSLPPTTTDLGDISTFDYFAKQDVLTFWTEVTGGKKVTPAWGGAKLWKVLQDLKTKHPEYVEDMTDLQILRILDEQGGFKGKPKTYESVVVEWLKTSASFKLTAKIGQPDASLNPIKLKPVASQVTPPTATAQFGLIPHEAKVAFDTGVKSHSGGVWLDHFPKYKPGEPIGYTLTDDGSLLRISAYPSEKKQLKVELYKNGEWIVDEVFDDWAPIVNHYNVHNPQWSIVPPKSATGKSLIPGKMPNDVVGDTEIWESRYLWGNGDIIAEAHTQDDMFRLVSNGQGDLITYHHESGSKVWKVFGTTYAADNPSPFTSYGLTWKLTGDVLKKDKPSTAIPGKKEGDVVTPVDVYQAATQRQGSPDTIVVAYAYAPDTNTEYRVITGGGGLPKIQFRTPGAQTTWGNFSITSVDEFTPLKFYTWRVAKGNGQPPDMHIAQLPTQSKIAMKTSTKLSVAAGDELSAEELWTAGPSSFSDYDIIAFGHNPTTLTEYRAYTIDGHIVVEWKAPAAGWQEYGVPSKTDLLENYPIKWTAAQPGMKATPSSVGAKNLKKMVTKKFPPVKPSAPKVTPPPAKPLTPKKLTGNQTHIPGKVTGDEVSVEDIMAHADKYVEGQIIATKSSYNYGNLRVMSVGGHLVQQKQTKAGAWGGTKVITHKYHFDGGHGWKAGDNSFASAAQIKAAKKAVDKQLGVAPPVTSTTKTKMSPTPSTSVTNLGTPIQLQHIDITVWNTAEQDEIHAFFRSTNVYTSASPDQIWGRVQAVKSHFQTKYKGKYLDLNEIEILRIVDARRAAKKGIPDDHAYETKVVNWLKTPAGKAWVNKRIDAPIAATDVPRAMSALDDPSNPDPDKQSYVVITNAQGKQYREESHKKYGSWKPGEKEAQKTYTGGSYTSWNAAIQRGDIGSYRTQIVRATQGARPSTRPMLLHRGTSFAELNDPSITSYETLLAYVGRTYTSRGFTSTSVGGKAAFGGQLLIEVEAPIGTPMTYVADFSNFKSENETTLPPHLIYQILSVKKASNGHTTVMRVRVIGVADPHAK